MPIFSRLQNMSRNTKLLVVAIVACCFAFLLVELDTMPTFIPKPAPVLVAVVQRIQTDVRHKPYEGEAWYHAEAHTEIMQGDAIYSGADSNSTVRMESGGVLELGAQTLVIFDAIDGVTIPDLARGEVRIVVTGQMKISISGEITDFAGAQSELLFTIDKNGTRIRSLKGQTTVARGGTVVRDLTTGEELNVAPAPAPSKVEVPVTNEVSTEAITVHRKLVAAEPEAQKIPDATPVVEAPIVTPAPVVEAVATPEPTPVPEPVVERTEILMRAKKVSVARPSVKERLKGKTPALTAEWNDAPGAKSYTVEVFRKDGEKLVSVRKIKTTETQIDVPFKQTGDFKLRVSADVEYVERKPASIEPEKAFKDFSLKPLVSYPKPEGLFPHDRQLIVAKNGDPLYFKWQRSKSFALYVLQFSTDANFKVVSHEMQMNSFELKQNPDLTAGNWYWRVRGVSDTGESSWGKTKQFKLVYD